MHCLTLPYLTLQYTTVHYITLHYTALHYITLHYITLHYITLHYITLHYITLHYITYMQLHLFADASNSKVFPHLQLYLLPLLIASELPPVPATTNAVSLITFPMIFIDMVLRLLLLPLLSFCLHICIYTHTHETCTNIYIYIYTFIIHLFIPVHMYTCVPAVMYIYLHISLRVSICMNIYVYTHNTSGDLALVSAPSLGHGTWSGWAKGKPGCPLGL